MFDTLLGIHGLVTRGSSVKRHLQSRNAERASSKPRDACYSSSGGGKPSLKLVQHYGFFVCRLRLNTPQSGLANGPEWAALKKHNRMRTTNACVPDLVEVLEQEWWDCDNALAPIPMNRPSLALGDRDDR